MMNNKSRGSIVAWEYLRFTLIALLIIIPVRLWVAQPFIVSGASMEPTFENGDYLIVDELSYHLRQPEKGEVIIFRYPLNPTKFFIKRIVGLPDETIEIDGRSMTLGDNEYFVMGDNRNNSSDSRVWGPVDKKLIIGRAFVRLWPFSDTEMLPGQNSRLMQQYAQ